MAGESAKEALPTLGNHNYSRDHSEMRVEGTVRFLLEQMLAGAKLRPKAQFSAQHLAVALCAIAYVSK